MRAGIDTSIRARPSCETAGRSRLRYGSFRRAADAPRTDSADIRRRASRAARTNSPQPVTNPHAHDLRTADEPRPPALRKRKSRLPPKTQLRSNGKNIRSKEEKQQKEDAPRRYGTPSFFSFAGRLSCRHGNGAHGPVAFAPDYTQPCASMALATFMKPAMLAPLT